MIMRLFVEKLFDLVHSLPGISFNSFLKLYFSKQFFFSHHFTLFYSFHRGKVQWISNQLFGFKVSFEDYQSKAWDMDLDEVWERVIVQRATYFCTFSEPHLRFPLQALSFAPWKPQTISKRNFCSADTQFQHMYKDWIYFLQQFSPWSHIARVDTDSHSCSEAFW